MPFLYSGFSNPKIKKNWALLDQGSQRSAIFSKVRTHPLQGPDPDRTSNFCQQKSGLVRTSPDRSGPGSGLGPQVRTRTSPDRHGPNVQIYKNLFTNFSNKLYQQPRVQPLTQKIFTHFKKK